MSWCKHYNGCAKSTTCGAGVHYRELAAGGSMLELPCFGRGEKGGRSCSLAVFPTAEELAEREREDRKRADGIRQVRALIMSHVGEDVAAGKSVNGTLSVCPVCMRSEVRFAVCGSNGHVMAACATEDCVRWRE